MGCEKKENNELSELKQKVAEVHSKVENLTKNLKLSGELKSEFKVQVEQYENLFTSLEQMKTLSSDEKTIANLEDQQRKVLKEHMQWEVEFAHRITE